MDPRRILHGTKVLAMRRAHDLSIAEARRSSLDLARLNERYAWVGGLAAARDRLWSRFDADHAWYVRHVGHPNHAASLELCVFLTHLCEQLRPRRLVDLGSGFTSYVLRRYAAEAPGPLPEVWSVDDSADWLAKTREYLYEKGLDTDRTLTWAEFVERGVSGFDIVVHDMGTMIVREQTLPGAVALARSGGLVVVDDVHKPEFRRAALRWLQDNDRVHYSLKALTRDALTRYAELVVG